MDNNNNNKNELYVVSVATPKSKELAASSTSTQERIVVPNAPVFMTTTVNEQNGMMLQKRNLQCMQAVATSECERGESIYEMLQRMNGNLEVLRAQMGKVGKDVLTVQKTLYDGFSEKGMHSGRLAWMAKTNVCTCCTIISCAITISVVFVIIALLIAQSFL
jgi:hypothetical protein